MKILQISTIDKEPIYSAIHLDYSTFKIKVNTLSLFFIKNIPRKSKVVEF